MAGMGRKGTVTFRKGCSRKKGTRSSFPKLWLWPCEVQKLYKKLKLPKFGEKYRIENLRVTTIPRILHYISSARQEGRKPETIEIESNLSIFKDESCVELVVVYKQNVLSSEKAREVGIISNYLYVEAPFVNRSRLQPARLFTPHLQHMDVILDTLMLPP